jgi:hypothetical protein
MKYLGGSTANTKDVVTQDQIVGIANFTYTLNIASPNATVPVIGLGVVSIATNADLAITPKGTGAITAQVADSTSTGGNKRGGGAVDLQTTRTAATSVASGANSFTAGSNNTASATASIAMGLSNTASAIRSVALGASNTSSGQGAFTAGESNNATAADSIAIGNGNTASLNYSAALGGTGNMSNGMYSVVVGGTNGTNRGIAGVSSWASSGAALGRTQTEQFLLRVDTVGATPTRITTDGLTASSTNGPVLPNTSTYYCRIRISARNTTSGDSASWTGTALIHREANAASTVLIGTPVITQDYASASLATAAVAITADTTLGALAVTVTGIVATNIRWVAHVETLESTN